MTAPKFTVEDRVAVYDTLATNAGRILGIVTGVSAAGWHLDILLETGVHIRAHHKQCRKLVKKKARTWWILPLSSSKDSWPVSLEYTQAMRAWDDARSNSKWIEVKEVRKK